jgi:hypothetical protein
VKQLTASEGAADDHFCNSVSISGDTIVAGAYENDVGANSRQGSVYIDYYPYNNNNGIPDNLEELGGVDNTWLYVVILIIVIAVILGMLTFLRLRKKEEEKEGEEGLEEVEEEI